MINPTNLTDEELATLTTATLNEMAHCAIFGGRDDEAIRIGRIMRERRDAERQPALERRADVYRRPGWPLPYDPDDDCEERGVVDLGGEPYGRY
jgi:hypothetical protein